MKTKKTAMLFIILILSLLTMITLSCHAQSNKNNNNDNAYNNTQKEEDIFKPNFKYIYTLIEAKQTQEKNWLGIKGDITFHLSAIITNTGNIDTFQINLTIYGEQTGATLAGTIGNDSIRKIIPINQSIQIDFEVNTGSKVSGSYALKFIDYTGRYQKENGGPIDIF